MMHEVREHTEFMAGQFDGCSVYRHFGDPRIERDSAASKFGNALMGVNMRLADESDLAGIELRYPDGRAWSGEGDFGYVREAHIFGQRATPG